MGSPKEFDDKLKNINEEMKELKELMFNLMNR